MSANFSCPLCEFQGPIGYRCPTHHLYLSDPRSLERAPKIHHLGQVVGGQYVILGLLGRGGMATVYWCLEARTHRRLAIKIMHRDLRDSEVSKQRFEREARSITSLDNPRVVKCYEYGADEDQQLVYIVMEFLEGTTLNTFMAHRGIDMAERFCIASQLLEGLAAIHEGGIVHRDIKPGNIMLCEAEGAQACVKIIDFGLARAMDGSDRHVTQLGDVLGTARYMSPEHLNGSHTVGTPSDVYAFGVILYELLSGQSPYEAKTPLDMLKLHATEPIPDLIALPGIEVESALVHFVARCLDKDPQTRFKDGAEALGAWWMLDLPDEGPIDLTTNWRSPDEDPKADLFTIELSASDLLTDVSIDIDMDDSQSLSS